MGKGGGIDIQTGSLFVTNGAGLSTSTSGQGNAGSVNINARDTVSFDKESAALSIVGSQAVGKGGGINIQTGELSFTNSVFLSASSKGSNNMAGNIDAVQVDLITLERKLLSKEQGKNVARKKSRFRRIKRLLSVLLLFALILRREVITPHYSPYKSGLPHFSKLAPCPKLDGTGKKTLFSLTVCLAAAA